jgi:hypothetical protein
MKTIVDSHFMIGSSHSVCQDYATHTAITNGETTWSIAVLCDGCSGSPHTDFGSRIIAHNVCISIVELLKSSPGHEIIERIPDFILSGPIMTAISAAAVTNVPKNCLDTTLWISITESINGEHVFTNIFGWGDGAVVIKSGDIVHTYLYDYPSVGDKVGAPFYIMYNTEKARSANYEKVFSGEFSEYHIIDDGDLKTTETEIIARDYVSLSICNTGCSNNVLGEVGFPAERQRGNHKMISMPGIESISVLSDGIRTYNEPSDNEFGSVAIMARELVSYRNLEKRFVLRRMKKTHNRKMKERIFHTDDLSMISTVFDGEE